MIVRLLQQEIEKLLLKGKAILLFGHRQSGKSTLIECLLKETGQQWLYLNGDHVDIKQRIASTIICDRNMKISAGLFMITVM